MISVVGIRQSRHHVAKATAARADPLALPSSRARPALPGGPAFEGWAKAMEADSSQPPGRALQGFELSQRLLV